MKLTRKKVTEKDHKIVQKPTTEFTRRNDVFLIIMPNCTWTRDGASGYKILMNSSNRNSWQKMRKGFLRKFGRNLFTVIDIEHLSLSMFEFEFHLGLLLFGSDDRINLSQDLSAYKMQIILTTIIKIDRLMSEKISTTTP